MSQINCHIPIKLRITGHPSDAQLDQLSEEIVRALTARIAIAEETISSRFKSRPEEAAVERYEEDVKVSFSSYRHSTSHQTYSIPSYEEGTSTEIPLEEPNHEAYLMNLEKWLEEKANIDVSSIDWAKMLPILIENPPWETVTMVEISDFSRYMMFLEMLKSEAQYLGLEPFEGKKSIGTDTLAALIMDYITTLPQEVFPEEIFYTQSEKFLKEWLEEIKKIKFVPEGFDVEIFKPWLVEEEIEQERNRILVEFIKKEATGLMSMFILDEWTRSPFAPEEWLAQLNLEDFREKLVWHLTEEFMDIAQKDKKYIAALRDASVEKTLYDIVRGLYALARASESVNENLYEALWQKPWNELDEFQISVAENPYKYWEMNKIRADVTYKFLSHVSPVGQNILDLLEMVENELLSYGMPEIYVRVETIGKIVAYLKQRMKNLRDLKKEEKLRVTKEILRIIDLSFSHIAEVVKNHIEFAERFIREDWIPMLKEIAKENLTRNRDDLQLIYDNWEVANEEIITRLREGALEYEIMAYRLEEGLYDSIEMNGQRITVDDVEKLRDAAQFMRDEAEIRRDPVGAMEKREEIKEAIDIYDTVKEDIENDEYDPLNYSKHIYVKARRRLGISEFPEFTTVGIVLGGQEVAKENPFLARAIVAWRWQEGVKRTIYTGTLMATLGILTVAAMVATGGAAGGIIGPVLTALDIGISMVMGIKGIADANELLNMAKLDIRQDIRGISVEDAEKALKHAWIGFGVTVIISVGVTALYARAVFKARGKKISLFEKTSITPDATLPAGEGWTDKLGNITYSIKGTMSQQKLALYHEKVHSFLSPKLRFLRNWRADIGMSAYDKSSLLKYLEEALAETYAQLKVHGLRGLPEGIRFPVTNGYVTVGSVLTEAAIGTVVVGGITYGVYVLTSKE